MHLTYRQGASDEDARRVGFRGSPSILVDGTDPFGLVDAPGRLCCRVYPSPDGPPTGAPTLAQLQAVLPRRA